METTLGQETRYYPGYLGTSDVTLLQCVLNGKSGRSREVGFSRPAGSGFQRILTLSELPQHAQGSFSGLTVTGNYTQTGAAALTEQFGSPLHVNLNATLSGALNVTINPKHPPQTGAKYTALTFSSLSGEFTSVTQGFKLTTTANSIQVTKQ